MNRKKKTFSIPKVNLTFLEDKHNEKRDEEISNNLKPISSSRSEDNADEKGGEDKKGEFFSAYEADRETDTTSNEGTEAKKILQRGKEAAKELTIYKIAQSCSCCVSMLALSMVFMLCAFLNLPLIGSRISNMSYM